MYTRHGFLLPRSGLVKGLIMKLSTKARYAITAMFELALHEKSKPVTLADISEYERISLSYLEQLFARLRSGGLVKGVRGPGGGYYLAKPASEITIAQIVNAINSNDKASAKHDVAEDRKEEQAKLESMWGELSDKINVFLDGITLEELVKAQSGNPLQGESQKQQSAA